NTRVSQARSSGRKPEFFWLDFQFLRSISWCAMFQSPHRMTSWPLFFRSERPREPGALLGQEAGILLVGFPVPEVDLLVRDVPVAAQDDVMASFLQIGTPA